MIYGMETLDGERIGVLILRAWVEADGYLGLRVRITRIAGTVHGGTVEPVSSTFAPIDGVCTMVRVWLEELQHGLEAQLPLDTR
jgi:hypothetical protein